MSLLVALLTLLASAAAAAAVVLLASKVRQHVLADESYLRGESADERFDELQRRIRPLERRRRVDHLLALAGVAERSGRLRGDASRRLEQSLLKLHDDVLQDES